MPKAPKIFLSAKIGQFFFTKYMANDDFSEPLDALIPKISFSFFPDFWVWVTSQPWGSDSVGFWGSCQFNPFWGGVRPEGSIDPPPPRKQKPGLPRVF